MLTDRADGISKMGSAIVREAIRSYLGPEEMESAIVLDLSHDLPPVLADRIQIQQVIINLLTNAIKFTPEGGKVRVLVEVHDNIAPPLYQFSVIDTGAGISQDKLKNIFDRFFQAEEEVNQDKGGVGIGLSLVYELAEWRNARSTTIPQAAIT